VSGTGPQLFFQIAAALIPALLFAGSTGYRPQRVLALVGTGIGRIVVIGFVVALALAAVVAEYLSIAGALSPSVAPSPYRIVFVANVIALSTVFVAVGSVTPWLEGRKLRSELADVSFWPSPPPPTRGPAVVVVISSMVVIATFGSGVLSESVGESLEQRALALQYCQEKVFADLMDRLVLAQEREESIVRRLDANVIELAGVSRDRKLTAKAREDALVRIRGERRALERDLDTARDQIERLVRLAVPDRPPPSIDAYLTSTGCP
jgi:hypothetical protein